MRKSLVLMLTAVGGSASYATGIAEIDRDGSADPSTWRWHVSSILESQKSLSIGPIATIGAMDAFQLSERYQRYSPSGRPERRP